MKKQETKIARKQKFGKRSNECKKVEMAKEERFYMQKITSFKVPVPYACLLIYQNGHMARRILKCHIRVRRIPEMTFWGAMLTFKFEDL